MRVRKSTSGTAVVELVFLLFLFGAILFGTIDFARLFYDAVKVTDGARAGAQWGMRGHVYSGDHTGIEASASNNAQELGGFTATADRVCRCEDDSIVNCSENNCPEGPPEIWIQVDTEKTFTTLVNFPGVPNSVVLGQRTLMRVQ